MKYVILGRTGLKVSVAGLGAGGHSRLGQATGKSEHLTANVEALLKPPLPNGDLQRLEKIFGKVDSVTGG